MIALWANGPANLAGRRRGRTVAVSSSSIGSDTELTHPIGTPCWRKAFDGRRGLLIPGVRQVLLEAVESRETRTLAQSCRPC